MAKKGSVTVKEQQSPTKKWYQRQASITKKGSDYTTKDGEIKEYSDFQRGKAAGRMEQRSREIELYNKNKK